MTEPAPPSSAMAAGVVVMAVHRPDPMLLRRQLKSLQAQSVPGFRCLVGADGDRATVERLVRDVVRDDPRFQVVGWDHNVGFYLNYERLLLQVPADAAWVALCDQDDEWYPTKLERLTPLLAGRALVTGQARVVASSQAQVLLPRTDRRVVPAEDLLFRNQVTGSFSVFRRELLDLALPFPRLRTSSQLHDHWLGLCATVFGGYSVVDDVLQDYVQHGANQVGEEAVRGGWTPLGFLRRTADLAERFEGSRSPRACARAHQRHTFGWRRAMLESLEDRTALPPGLARIRAELTSRQPLRDTARLLARLIRSPASGPSVAAAFLPGVPYELVQRWSRGGRPADRFRRASCGPRGRSGGPRGPG